MAISKLAIDMIPSHSNNYEIGRDGAKICKLTPHHMAGKLTAKRCGELFQDPKRKASANYGIGYDGEIICYVDEDNEPYTSSSRSNDRQAITVEISNSSTGGDWPISEKSWNALIELAVDVCTRHGFRLEYDGTKNGSLTRHNMFAATSCPGPYLQNRLPELARIVNARLDSVNVEPEPKPVEAGSYLVKITTDVLNIRSGPGTNYSKTGQIRDRGIYTIVEESSGKGANLWGKLKSGAGWISLDYTERQTSGEVPVKEKQIQKGDKVRFLGTTDYNGKRLASWVKDYVFDVFSISGDRVVIGKDGAITAAVKKSDLILA